MRRRTHGRMHGEWDDGRGVIFSWDIVSWAHNQAYKKMPFAWRHQLEKAMNFGRMYGAEPIALLEHFTHRTVESPHGH